MGEWELKQMHLLSILYYYCGNGRLRKVNLCLIWWRLVLRETQVRGSVHMLVVVCLCLTVNGNWQVTESSVIAIEQ